MILSSKRYPCPVCGRTKDGDCRITIDALVLCHTHQGQGLKPGNPSPNGRYRFLKASREAQGFGIWKPAEQWNDRSGRGHQAHPARLTTTTSNSAMATPHPLALPADASAITLARLQAPVEQPPEHWPDGQRLDYSPTQRVVVSVTDDGNKRHRPQHRLTPDGPWIPKAGEEPWPFWHQGDAITHGRGSWVFEAEGEKCAAWIRAAGFACITHPGHNHSDQPNQARYKALQQAGVRGVVYLADSDAKGQEKAAKCLSAANAAGLPLLGVHAADVWPDLPAGGSIDDALGTPAERVQQLIEALPAAIQQQSEAVTPAEHNRQAIKTKAELQSFLKATYRLQFNELTRLCEINGQPLDDQHLADSFLAQQHGIEVTKQRASDSFEFVAKCSPYNPVERYLQGLRQRSDLRLIPMQELAAAFAIAPDDHVSQQLLACHLAGATLRGLNPGHKHDQILVFRGAQGTFKSSAIEALAGPWYDSATRVEELESKDFLARVNGAWLFEIDEAEHTLLKRTASEFKGFLSRRNDTYVEKFEKSPKTHPRRSVLFGTTNAGEFLNDSTGNRRAWVINTGDRNLDPEWIADNRDHIWGTILTWVDWGLKNYIPQAGDLAQAVADRAQQSNLSDPWEPLLSETLESIPLDQVMQGIAMDDLMTRALQISAAECSRDQQMRVTRVVAGSGFRTHDNSLVWEAKKKRYRGGRPRAGYSPVLKQDQRQQTTGSSTSVPTVPTSPEPKLEVGTEVGTAETPWQNRALETPFQPVPTFSLIKRNKEIGDSTGAAAGVVTQVPPEVGTGRNTPEKPCAGTHLAVPTRLEQEEVGTERLPQPRNGLPAQQKQPLPDQPAQTSDPDQPPATAAPAGLVARHRQHLQTNPVRITNAPLADDLAAFLNSTQASLLPTDQNDIQRDNQAGSGDPEADLLHLEHLLSISTWQLLEQMLWAPSPAHPLDQPQPTDSMPASAAPASAIPADFNPTTWAAALPSYKQTALRLRLEYPSKPPAALINTLHAADSSMPSAFSGGNLKTFLQLPEALAWIAAQTQQEVA